MPERPRADLAAFTRPMTQPPAPTASVILCYHRVARIERDPFQLAVAPERFAEHVDVIARQRPVSLTALAAEVAAGDVPPGGVAVTFDDGYVDNLRAAKPLLEAAGVPATVFVTTGATGSQVPYWWDELEDLLASGGGPRALELAVDGETRTWAPGATVGARFEVWAWLRTRAPESIAAGMRQVRAWAGAEPAVVSDALRTMTAEELRELTAGGTIACGAHTRTHPLLGAHAAQVQRAEIGGSRDDLEGWLGRAVPSFAYPFGRRVIEYRGSSVRVVRRLGFECAVSTDPGPVTGRSPRHELPRHVVPVDLDGAAFERWLAERLAPPPEPSSPRRLAKRVRRDLRERLTPAGRL